MVPEGTSSIERNQVSKYVKPKKLVPEGPKRKKAAGKNVKRKSLPKKQQILP